jgi:hypothetical protein
MENKNKMTYESPSLEVVPELYDVLTTSGDSPFGDSNADPDGWT